MPCTANNRIDTATPHTARRAVVGRLLCVPEDFFNLCQFDHKEITVTRGGVWTLYIKSGARLVYLQNSDLTPIIQENNVKLFGYQ